MHKPTTLSTRASRVPQREVRSRGDRYTPQAVVRITSAMDNRLPMTRNALKKKTIQRVNLKPDGTTEVVSVASTPFPAPIDTMRGYRIRPGELVFKKKHGAPRAQTVGIMNNPAACFSVFNGLPKYDDMNMADFCRQFKFVGIAFEGADIVKGSEARTFALAMGGSATVDADIDRNIDEGVIVAWAAPRLDGNSANVQEGRLLARLVPWEHIRPSLELFPMYRRLKLPRREGGVADATDNQLETDLRMGNGTRLDSTAQLALILRKCLRHILFVGAAASVLARQGEEHFNDALQMGKTVAGITGTLGIGGAGVATDEDAKVGDDLIDSLLAVQLNKNITANPADPVANMVATLGALPNQGARSLAQGIRTCITEFLDVVHALEVQSMDRIVGKTLERTTPGRRAHILLGPLGSH